MFRSAKQNRIFQDIVDQIQEAILSGKLKPGEMLPSERELKDVMKVSRGTLREALRVLEEKGLIEMRLGAGGGALVKEASFEKICESLDILIRARQVPLGHLSEFRQNIEGEIAELAASRLEEKETALLESLYLQAETIFLRVKGGERNGTLVHDFIDSDKKFHKMLAKISKNLIYESIQHTVHSNIDQYYDTFLIMQEKEMEENLKDLKDILDALKKGDGKRARVLAGQHVFRFNQYMEARGL